jgi:hypothetical protein
VVWRFDFWQLRIANGMLIGMGRTDSVADKGLKFLLIFPSSTVLFA